MEGGGCDFGGVRVQYGNIAEHAFVLHVSWRSTGPYVDQTSAEYFL